MEYNREPRNRHTQICPTDFFFFFTKIENEFNGGRIDFGINDAGAIRYL